MPELEIIQTNNNICMRKRVIVLFVHKDIIDGVLLKSIAFGIVVSLIAVFQGYTTPPTSEGVAYATTRTVVASSIAILALDFVLTSFLI